MCQRVLVPQDGSTLAEEILSLAVRISRGFNIPVHLVTVVPLDSVAGARTRDPDACQEAVQNAQDDLSAISERVRRSVGPKHVTMAVTVAKVADAIV
jgi:nucleotide-binding universal stress UspA family protein